MRAVACQPQPVAIGDFTERRLGAVAQRRYGPADGRGQASPLRPAVRHDDRNPLLGIAGRPRGPDEAPIQEQAAAGAPRQQVIGYHPFIDRGGHQPPRPHDAAAQVGAQGEPHVLVSTSAILAGRMAEAAG